MIGRAAYLRGEKMSGYETVDEPDQDLAEPEKDSPESA